MMLWQLLFLTVLSATLTIVHNKDTYSIPQPEIAIYANGLLASIPDEPGIQLFYFHGTKIGEGGPTEADQISMKTWEPTDGKWILYDKSHSFKVGDVIHYWLYVKKDGKGYRKSSGYYKVKGSYTQEETLGTSNTSNCSSLEEEVSALKQTVYQLQSQVKVLSNITMELLTAMNDTDTLSYLDEWTWE